MRRFRRLLYTKLMQLTFSSAEDLLLGLLVDLGYQRLAQHVTTDEREPAHRFWYKLEERSSDFTFNESCPEQTVGLLIALSNSELEQEKHRLIAEFLKVPYDDGMEQLTLAAYSWLLCSNMESFKRPEESVQAAKLRYCKELALDLGVF